MVYKPLPIEYRKSSPLVFNTDFFDFVAGAAYKTFYLCAGELSGASISYYATTNVITGTPVISPTGSSTTNYDITFNNDITIAAADCLVSAIQTGSDGETSRVDVDVIHYDGSTETSLGTAASVGETGASQHIININFALTKKTFKKGDILRFKITMYTTGGAPYYHINPAGSEPFKIFIPFEVDL